MEEEKLINDLEKLKNSDNVIKIWKTSVQATLVVLEILTDLLAAAAPPT